MTIQHGRKQVILPTTGQALVRFGLLLGNPMVLNVEKIGSKGKIIYGRGETATIWREIKS